MASEKKEKEKEPIQKLKKNLENRTYLNSNFRRLYKQFGKKQTFQSILKGFKSIIHLDKRYEAIHNFWLGLSAHPVRKKWPIGRKVVYCWTVENPKFYGGLKYALIPDDQDKLRGWMPFIRAMNVELVCKKQSAMLCYRGSRMSKDDFKIFNKGMIYRVPYYVATTKNIQRAQKWVGMKYLITYQLPKNCPNGWNIEKWSAFQVEEEVLLPPYTALKVLEVGAVSMRVEVLDNYNAPKAVSAFNDASTNGKAVYGGLAGTCCYELTKATLDSDNKFLG